MTVKIVTDSVSDVSFETAKQLGITVVPLYVRFGQQTFKDRIDITTEDFYKRLVADDVMPATTQPTPNDFATIYQKLAKETSEILVIVLSKKLSGTYDSAMAATRMVDKKVRITVIDSELAAMGYGLLAIAAAKAAKKGAKLDELTEMVQRAMPRAHAVMYFDTLKYLSKGGRIGKAKGLLGALLSFKPILTMKDGEVSPVTRVRSKAAGLDYLVQYVTGYPKIQEMAVEYATTPEDADELIARISKVFPKERIYRSKVSPVLGTYAGPGVLLVAVLEAES